MGNTISVSTSAELYEALAQATGGETILLAQGDYGALTMNGKPGFPNEFASNITITSADPDKPAVFNHMDIHGGKNITVDNVVMDYTFIEGEPDWFRPFEVNNSENVNITNTVFDGVQVLDGVASEDGFGHGYGLSVRFSSDVVVEGNEFFGFGRGAIFSESDGIVVSDNDIHSMRSDGLNFAQVQDVLIEDNHIHDFIAAYDSQDHRDMIQFWTAGTTEASSDITIRNNLLDMGEGSWTQSIFMGNESVNYQGGGRDMYYQNVLIEGNTIYNAHLHGITVGEADGVTISDNSILAVVDLNNPDQDDSLVWVPRINVQEVSTDVFIERNVTFQITGENGQNDWRVDDNALVQNLDPTGDGYYEDVFVTSSRTVGEDGHNFVVRPGSMLDLLDVGTPELRTAPDLETAGAVYQVSTSSEGANARVFDASLTAQLLADAGIEGAQYRWDFGDGTTAEGQQVAHEFTYSGGHDVQLTVILEGGQTLSAGNTVDIRGGNVVSFDGEAGNDITAYGFGQEWSLGGMDAYADGSILLGTEQTATISRSVLDGIRGSDALSLDFTLAGEGAGEVMRLHMSFFSKVTPDGSLVVQMYNDDGQSFLVTTSGARLNDGALHDVSVQLEDGALRVFIDDVLSGQTAFSGTLPETGSWDLSFGNPWNQGADFNGRITEFEINAGDELEPIDPNMENSSTELDALPPLLLGESETTHHVPEEPLPPVEDEVVPPTLVQFDEMSPPPLTADIALGIPQAPDPASNDDGLPQTGNSDVAQDAMLRDATVVISEEETIALNGDHVALGRLREFEDSSTLGFTVDFTNDGSNDDGRLVWNHMKLGLSIKDDEIMVNAATKDEGFKFFTTQGLGLSSDEVHTATVLLDSDTDRLQVVVNDTVVLDIDDVDFDHIGAGGHEWGWSLGTPTAWGHEFEGDVTGLSVSDQIVFEDEDIVLGSNLIDI